MDCNAKVTLAGPFFKWRPSMKLALKIDFFIEVTAVQIRTVAITKIVCEAGASYFMEMIELLNPNINFEW